MALVPDTSKRIQQMLARVLDWDNSRLDVSLSSQIAGEDLTNDILKVENQASYLNGTTSQLVKTGAGRVWGIIVNSHSSGTFKFWDNTSAATPVLTNTHTLATGPQVITFPAAVRFTTGLYITVGGTIDYTVIYK